MCSSKGMKKIVQRMKGKEGKETVGRSLYPYMWSGVKGQKSEKVVERTQSN